MINNIVLTKLGKQVNSYVTLTWIAIFQVLGSVIFYNTQMELVELEKRGIMQQVLASVSRAVRR